uniref:Uncharacterized protein n=1 Tax=Setaria italica TaxID=4555 RepID=K4AHZ0_SETIT
MYRIIKKNTSSHFRKQNHITLSLKKHEAARNAMVARATTLFRQSDSVILPYNG